MIIPKPKRIAICLISGNQTIETNQIKEIKKIEKYFDVEWYLRSDKFTGQYNSFSQIINECVSETDSEFIIIISEKVSPCIDDILHIMDDLTDGFCFSSIVSFGFFGITKEVFRRIGLMDERFVGGEYEDYDFYLRLKQFNKAINARFVYDKYTTDLTHIKPRGGLSKSFFYTKWKKIDNIFYKTDKFSEEKKLPVKLQKRNKQYLYQSWKTWEYSNTDSFISSLLDNTQVSDTQLETNTVIAPCTIGFFNDNGYLNIYFSCEEQSEIIVVMASTKNSKKVNLLDGYPAISSNHLWKANELINDGTYTIEFYHEGQIIAKNILHFPIFNKESINTSLQITKIK